MNQIPPEVWQIIGAALGTGLVVRLLDRWRYRRKPDLDLAKLAQDIAATTLAQAKAELVEAYASEASLRQEVSSLRMELAQARIEIQRLTALVQAEKGRV